MDTTSIRPDSPKVTAESLNARAERGLRLYQDHGHRIERIAGAVYRVPSQDGERSYDVRYGEVEECPCPDFQYRNGITCCHLFALGVAHAKGRFGRPEVLAGDPFAAAAAEREKRIRPFLSVLLSSCAECGTQDADYYVSVPADDLTYFESDELCPECSANHGLL